MPGEPIYMALSRLLLIGALVAATLAPVATSATEPERCPRSHARELVKQFIASYNNGDFKALDRVFAKGEDFYSYRVFPERQSPFSERRDQLIPYFRERHEVKDHFELVEFELYKERVGIPRMWGFRFTIERTSDDLAPWGNGTLSGKGAAECKIGLFNASWSP